MLQMRRWIWIVVLGLGLVACMPNGAAANGMVLAVTVNEGVDAAADEAKPAPTATALPPAQHWVLAHGEKATLLCGGTPKAEGVPAGQLSMAVNGVDSVAWDCKAWEGGGSAAATPGEADQHLQLSHGQTGYVLCGGESLDGTPAGQWQVKINGVDSIQLTCMAWEGGK